MTNTKRVTEGYHSEGNKDRRVKKTLKSNLKLIGILAILIFFMCVAVASAESKEEIFTNSTHHSATSSVTIQNDHLKIEVGNNGQYRGWTAAGDAIFYPYGTYPWSSFMTIKVNGSTYDNAPYSSNLDNYLTQETVKKSPVETETKWYIPEENLEITQNIILVGEQAKFILKLKNKGTATKTVSVRYEWDTQIADNDGAPLREEGGDLHEFEIAFEPVTFSYWSAYARPQPGSLVIYATWDTTPDKIIFAHWPEAYDTLWDYSWSSSRRFYTPGYTTFPESDSCVLMYWKHISLSPGEEKSIVTYYGTTVGGGVNVDILDILTKNLYEPEESIFIYVMVTSDGKFIDNLQKSAFKVSLDGSRVDILKFISLKIPLFEVPLYKLEIKAPQEEGRHDISVRVETGTGWGSDSVKIDVFEPFTFVHMTDVHIGDKPWWWDAWSLTGRSCPRPYDVGERRFACAIQYMNMLRPDFILISGDLVNFGENGEARDFYRRFLQILEGLNPSIKVYMVPGNHDWYRLGWLPGFDRGNLLNYNQIINNYMNRRGADRSYLIEPNNYIFSYGGFLFIGLDSGYATGRRGLGGGSGLTNEQMNALSGLDDSMPKIIFMHYPAVDDDCSSNCIQTNRDNFIEYCVENNVQVVLTGHTHANKMFNSRGEHVEVNSNERPLFIQTPSVTCDENNCEHGFRLIDCSRSKGVIIHQYTPRSQYAPIIDLENIWIKVCSPVNLHVYDAEGRHTGINMTTGEYERDIPHSFYLTGFTYETYNENNETVNVTVPEMTILYNTTWDYMIKVTANLTEEEKLSPEIETFNLTLGRQTNDSLTIISYFNVPVYENTTASVNFNMTTTNYTMCIDYDGDGNVDDLREPDSVDIDYAPDVRIISPQNNSHFLEGEKITFKGEGIDPEDGILTNDSLMWYSDINGAIGAGNEINVSLSPGMHHITLLAKDSSDQIKTDSITIFIRSTQPDMFVDILSGNETPKVGEEHESIVELISNRSYNFTIYIKNTGYGTLNNVSLVTNVSITKDVGDIEEGGERFVHIRFTPTQPGILTLKVTVKSKEIERNATRGLIINHFPLIVETDKDIYMQGETVMITTNTTNENPEVSYVDLRMNITIQGQNITETYSRPILYISSLGTQEISFSWDTTGKPAGNYTITARLIEQSNSSVVLSEASTSFEIILPNQPPIANANGPYAGIEGQPVEFNASASYDPEGANLTYYWKFGDGETAATNQTTITHIYAQEGNYTVTLIVNDSVQNSTSSITYALINDTEPKANFTANVTSGFAPLTVQFNDLSQSYDGIIAWEWDFNGDGIVDSNEQNPTHTYDEAGTYTVSLTVQESDGDSDTETKTDYITVTSAVDTEPPTIESVTLDTYINIPNASFHVTVEATDNIGVVSVKADGIPLNETGSRWEGDIFIPEGAPEGNYTLTITAEDGAGNKAQAEVGYKVVFPQGGFTVAIDPMMSSASGGDVKVYQIKIISNENFDDKIHVYISDEGIPDAYKANFSFNWTDKTIYLRSGETVELSLEVTIPQASGYKMFRVYADSMRFRTSGYCTGIVLIS